MQSMKLSNVLALVFLTVIALGVTGCGETVWTESHYYYPDWTPDGRIICVKEVAEYNRRIRSPFGLTSTERTWTKYYITTMSDEGTQETDIKEISRIGKVSASPLGNYIAYTDGNYIRIISNIGQDVNSINCEKEVNSVDWNPDEDKIVYSTYTETTKEINIISINDLSKSFIAYGDSISWSSNGIYVTYHSYLTTLSGSISGGIYVFNNLSGKETIISTMEGAHPDFLPDNIHILYDLGTGRGIKKISQLSLEKSYILNNYYSLYPKSSPTGQRVIYGEGTDAGIWIVNIDRTGLKQLR